MIPLAKIANNLEIIGVASAVSRYLKGLCSNKSITFHIVVLKKVRYALCPMPYALCPMPVGYLMLLRKAISSPVKSPLSGW